MINPVRYASKILHPPQDSPQFSLTLRQLYEKGIAPIECDLKISSWLNEGKLDKIVIKHEFEITLIQGKIELKLEEVSQLDFSVASEVKVADIDEDQSKLLNQHLKLPEIAS